MIRLSLITPEKVVFKDEVDSVSLPTTTGQIQVLEKHMPLVSVLAPGELKIQKGKETTFLAVSSGYIEVRPDSEVVVLANTAEHAIDIDEGRAEVARARARDLLKGKIASEAEYATVIGTIEKEWTRLRVARKHQTKRNPMGDSSNR